MAQSAKLQAINPLPGGKPLFGPAPTPAVATGVEVTARLDRLQGAVAPSQSLADQLNERLREKYREYERAASRLELRGEHDAAKVLRQAASKARFLRNGVGADQTAEQGAA